MLHCVAFECNVQAKRKQNDPKIRFHTFPKDKKTHQAWIHAIGRTSLPKNPRLCSKHFEEHCFKESYLMEVRILGSSRMLNPLKTDAVPTIFSHRKATPVRLSSVKRAEKRQPMEVCVCVLIMHSIWMLLSGPILEWYAWLVTRPSSLMFSECFWPV